MNKNKIIDGVLHIYCEEDGEYYPKYTTTESGMKMELDENCFIYVLEGDTLDESLGGESEPNDYNPF